MEWISSWIQGIIVAVIIATIVEMILPEGNSKKYIKVVTGVYILFSIISPAISKITGENFNLTNILDIDEYVETSTTNTYEELNQSQDEQIRSIYETSLKNDMKEKIQEKGYDVKEIILGIQNDEEYTLTSIEITLEEQLTEEKDTNTDNQIETVNEINIQIENENNQQSSQNNEQQDDEEKQENISSKEKKELKEYLSSVYQIEEENININ